MFEGSSELGLGFGIFEHETTVEGVERVGFGSRQVVIGQS